MNPGATRVYAEFQPAAALRTWVAAYWTFTVAPEQPALDHRVPPTGGAIVALNLAGGPAILVGPRRTPLVTPACGGDRFVGLHLWPGAHSAWLGSAQRPLREFQLPLETFLEPEVVRALEDALRQGGRNSDWAPLDRVLAEGGLRVPLDPSVMAAVARILGTRGRDPVGVLGAAVGLSSSQFRRRFSAAVELSPKELARLRRVRASATDALHGAGWAAIAAERGYADQAHLVREFRDLLGLPPEAFRRQGDRIAHHLLGG